MSLTTIFFILSLQAQGMPGKCMYRETENTDITLKNLGILQNSDSKN